MGVPHAPFSFGSTNCDSDKRACDCDSRNNLDYNLCPNELNNENVNALTDNTPHQSLEMSQFSFFVCFEVKKTKIV